MNFAGIVAILMSILSVIIALSGNLMGGLLVMINSTLWLAVSELVRLNDRK